MRLFLATDLSEEVREKLTEAVGWMTDFHGPLKVIRPKNYHVTLKFLGSVHQTNVPAILGALQKNLRGFIPARMRLEGWGSFGESGSKIFWAGLEPKNALLPLAEQIEKIMEDQGFAPNDRPFEGHVTLARQGSDALPPAFLKRWNTLEPLFPTEFSADSVTLYESNTTPSGPVYTPQAKISF